MLYPSIDKIFQKIGSKYLLVNVVAKRAKEMRKTGHYQMPEEEYKLKKNIGKALEEIANDMIIIKEEDKNKGK
ncbi:MAG: DNA-directed RNA polymerase subunit omega [Mollicutes bacterium]|nr:DNA-directed RNA polymerase subunit omega [Mollicutes bacterium]